MLHDPSTRITDVTVSVFAPFSPMLGMKAKPHQVNVINSRDSRAGGVWWWQNRGFHLNLFDSFGNLENNRWGAIHDSKYSTTRVLFASTYTAKQLKTIYYSLNNQ